MQRLRTWNERFRTRDHAERNLSRRLARSTGVQRRSAESARETASVITAARSMKRMLPGRSIEGMATAALYAAVRQANRPQTLDDMAVVSRVDEMEFTRAYRYLNREVSLQVGPPDPATYLSKFVSKLDADEPRTPGPRPHRSGEGSERPQR